MNMNSVSKHIKDERLKEYRKGIEMEKNANKKKPKRKRAYRKRKINKNYYKSQYMAPEWIELRERIINRDNNRCKQCGKENNTFHIHHLLYEADKKIWEVPDYYLVTLCPGCHKKEHSRHLIRPTKHY